MKKLITLLVLSLCLVISTVAYADETVNFVVEEEEVTLSVTYIDGVAMANPKELCNVLGLNINLYKGTNSLRLNNGKAEIILIDGTTVAYVNGEEFETPKAFMNYGKGWLMPVEFVVNATGYDINLSNGMMSVTNSLDESLYYTEQQLEEIVDSLDPVLRTNKYNMESVNGKFYDIYFFDDEKNLEVSEFLEPHMDKIYAMFYDIYDTHTDITVVLTKGRNSGLVTTYNGKTITFINIEEDELENILVTLVHELHHNFFQELNGASDDMWVNEAMAKLFPSVYLYTTEYEADTWDIYGLKGNGPIKSKLLDLDIANEILGEKDSWKHQEDNSAQMTALNVCMQLFNKYGIQEFGELLQNLGDGDALEALLKLEVITVE